MNPIEKKIGIIYMLFFAAYVIVAITGMTFNFKYESEIIYTMAVTLIVGITGIVIYGLLKKS